MAQDGFVEQENGFERRSRPALWDAQRMRKEIDGIGRMIAAGQSRPTIQAATVCSRATIAKIAKRLKGA